MHNLSLTEMKGKKILKEPISY